MINSNQLVKRQIDFIGIGAPKAATTWLCDCLNEHPSIFIPAEKELQFFGPIDKFYLDYTHNTYSKGLDWYLSHFRHHDGGHLVQGEFTPWYLYSEDIARNIKKHFPDVKIITVLRNPTERLYSMYLHVKSRHVLPSLEELIDNSPGFLNQGKYIDHLRTYAQHFAPEQMLNILYDDICSTPDTTIREVYSFLGVDTDYVPNTLTKRTNETAPKIHSVTVAYREQIRALKSIPLINSAITLLAQRSATQAIVRGMNKLFYQQNYRPLDDSVRSRLIEFYRPYNQELSGYLKRDLSAWNR